MQNQMMPKINLLKMPDPAARTQKYVNMMNATKQQEAAEQTLKIQQERAAREEALQEPALATAKSEADIKKLDFMMQFFTATANDIANSSTPDEVVARAERLKQQFPVPELQARIDETVNSLVSDPSRFEENRKRILTRTLDAKDQFAVNHSDIFDMDGNLYTKRTSPIGAFPTEITPGVVTGPPVTGGASRAGAPAETPRTPVAPPAGPVPVGKYGEARVIPDNARPLTPDQQDHIRRLQDELGMTNTPASFTRGGMATPTAGQMSPDMVPAILDSAINTGVMAQIDLDQMLAMSPPQARQGIMDVIRSSNISLQADAPSLAASAMPQQQPMAPNPVQRPQSQFADMRGPAPQASFADLGGQPQMQNTMAQYQVGQQIRGRNPSMPQSANVPLSRVAGEAEARLEPIPRIKERKAIELQTAEDFEEANKDKRIDRKVQEVFATKRAEKDADFLETYTDTVSKSRATLNALDQMIGDARIERDRIVIPKGGRRPHGGFEGVVGAGIPGVRFIPGTQAAGFDALLEQVQGGAFLKAFNDLRGGGAITQVEGEKATTALTRVRRAQSEIEFVKAAREFVEILRNGIKNADKRYARLTGEAPPAAAPPRKTPTKGSDGWGKAKVVGN